MERRSKTGGIRETIESHFTRKRRDDYYPRIALGRQTHWTHCSRLAAISEGARAGALAPRRFSTLDPTAPTFSASTARIFRLTLAALACREELVYLLVPRAHPLCSPLPALDIVGSVCARTSEPLASSAHARRRVRAIGSLVIHGDALLLSSPSTLISSLNSRMERCFDQSMVQGTNVFVSSSREYRF